MTTARAFVAIEIPEDVVGVIMKGRRNLERSLPPARWIRPERQHLTLLFLGDVSMSTLEFLTQAMRRELGGISAPRIALGGSGFFPDARRARVAWIGGEAPGAREVVEGVGRAADDAGLSGGSQPWSLHLTQARLKKPWPPEAVRVFIRWGEALRPAPFEAREVVVFTSELRPGGPVYTASERIALS